MWALPVNTCYLPVQFSFLPSLSKRTNSNFPTCFFGTPWSDCTVFMLAIERVGGSHNSQLVVLEPSIADYLHSPPAFVIEVQMKWLWLQIPTFLLTHQDCFHSVILVIQAPLYYLKDFHPCSFFWNYFQGFCYMASYLENPIWVFDYCFPFCAYVLTTFYMRHILDLAGYKNLSWSENASLS